MLKGGEIEGQYRIACFHKRNNKLNILALTAQRLVIAISTQQLLDWIVDRMNNQPDEGPMNHIASLLELANYPRTSDY